MTIFSGQSTPPSPCSSEGESDPVNHPSHYQHESGIEVITITETMGFCLGNVVKYVLRAGKKGCPIEDLKKARWYLDREIARLERARSH
jgi:hypothetical protein